MRNLEEFKNYLNHNIIVDPDSKDYPNVTNWFTCSTCGIFIYLNLDGILFYDAELLSHLLINEKLDISCEEYQIKKLLE